MLMFFTIRIGIRKSHNFELKMARVILLNLVTVTLIKCIYVYFYKVK